MAIYGLTVSEHGESMQRLAVTTKVAIGEVVKKNGATYPQKLDHFVFLRKGASTLEWEPDPDLIKHFGDKCREVWIVLLDDELENVFRTEYAWWSKTEKKCWGDGRQATRRTEKHPDGEDWTPCGDACKDLDAGSCKPSGDLYFILADFPRLGSICRLHTTSYRSIRQLHSAIEQIRTVTGGRLAGIRCRLVVRPEKSSFVDKDKKKKSTTIYALNLELAAADMQKMLGQMTQYAQLFDQTRKLLGDGGKKVTFVEDEPEPERAPDVAQEFYPAEEIAPAPEIQQPARASRPASEPIQPTEVIPPNGKPAVISKDQRMELFKVIVNEGWGADQAKQIMKEEFGFESTAAVTVEKFETVKNRFAKYVPQPPPGEYQATDDDIPI